MAKLLQIALMVLLLAGILFAGWVAIQGMQPMGGIGADPNDPAAGLGDLSYWDYMSDRLAASRQTPAACHRTRLIYLALALPVYPVLYTTAALFPESSLAQHTQASRLIPAPITWQQVPNTWWRLVREISWLAFTQPQWDFTPAVGERVRVDEGCQMPGF